MNVPRPFGSGDRDATFDPYDAFGPEHLPEPDEFLDGHDLLTDRDHVAFHRLTRERFEERGVYDMTFGYNLARLNLDARHPDAGFRYARETDDPAILRAEFTPTTEFCPQSDTLCLGAFRAWNGDPGRHEYDLVRVRVAPMHHQSIAINGKLSQLEAHFEETDDLGDPDEAESGTDFSGAPF